MSYKLNLKETIKKGGVCVNKEIIFNDHPHL